MNYYFLLPMIAIAVFVGSTDVRAQESKQRIPNQENLRHWPTPFLQIFGTEQADIAKRELLLKTSLRDLRFRCGRYWVDNYSRLISPDDREIGIWGIDAPAATFVPMRR